MIVCNLVLLCYALVKKWRQNETAFTIGSAMSLCIHVVVAELLISAQILDLTSAAVSLDCTTRARLMMINHAVFVIVICCVLSNSSAISSSLRNRPSIVVKDATALVIGTEAHVSCWDLSL